MSSVSVAVSIGLRAFEGQVESGKSSLIALIALQMFDCIVIFFSQISPNNIALLKPLEV